VEISPEKLGPRPRANGFIVGISITGITFSDAQMIEIDRKMDDGKLTTGSFITGTDRFIYILQKLGPAPSRTHLEGSPFTGGTCPPHGIRPEIGWRSASTQTPRQ
jgi:hypothetical protein